jgi:hypothetical protein
VAKILDRSKCQLLEHTPTLMIRMRRRVNRPNCRYTVPALPEPPPEERSKSNDLPRRLPDQ